MVEAHATAMVIQPCRQSLRASVPGNLPKLVYRSYQMPFGVFLGAWHCRTLLREPFSDMVLGAAVNVLTNPIFLRAGLVLIAAAFAFAMVIVIFRRMRRSLTEVDSEIGRAPDSLNQSPLHTYHAVIQQLKQQKHELTAQQQMDRRRTRATENISAAVLSHLSSGCFL